MRFDGKKADVLRDHSDPNLGGRDLDRSVASHLAVEFEQQTGIDVSGDQKAVFRLMEAAQSAREKLSIMPDANITIERLSQSKDFTKVLTRDEFNTIV